MQLFQDLGLSGAFFKKSFCRSSSRKDFLKESFVSAAEHDFCLLSFMIFSLKCLSGVQEHSTFPRLSV